MNHQPTFKLTPQRRPLYRRLTPVAWLLIGTGVLLAAVLGFGLLKGREKDAPLGLPAPTTASAAADTQPAATDTQPPAATDTTAPPTITVLPPTPTQWQEETLAPTLAPTLAASPTPEGWVWWADQMACEGEWCVPPEEVADEIVAAYWEWRAAIPFYYYELDMTPEQLEYHYIGRVLQLQLEFVSLVAETGAMWDGETILQEYDYEARIPHISSCTLDGLVCLLGETVQGNLTIHEYDLSIRQIVNSIQNPPDQQGGVNVWRFQYDLEDGRWKVEKYHEWIPAPAPY